MWVSKTAVIRDLRRDVRAFGEQQVQRLLAEEHALSSCVRSWLVHQRVVANVAELETLLRAALGEP